MALERACENLSDDITPDPWQSGCDKKKVQWKTVKQKKNLTMTWPYSTPGSEFSPYKIWKMLFKIRKKIDHEISFRTLFSKKKCNTNFQIN